MTKYFKNGIELDIFDYRQKKENRFRHRPFCCSDNAWFKREKRLIMTHRTKLFIAFRLISKINTFGHSQIL